MFLPPRTIRFDLAKSVLILFKLAVMYQLKEADWLTVLTNCFIPLYPFVAKSLVSGIRHRKALTARQYHVGELGNLWFIT